MKGRKSNKPRTGRSIQKIMARTKQAIREKTQKAQPTTSERISLMCTPGCGYVSSSMKNLKLHLNGEHSGELSVSGSAARDAAFNAGLIVCDKPGCGRAVKDTISGSPRKHKCTGTDEAQTRPTTPGKRKRTLSPRVNTPQSLPPQAPLTRQSSVETGIVTSSGRAVRRTLHFDEEPESPSRTDTQSQPLTDAPVDDAAATPVEEPEPVKFRSFNAYASYIVAKTASINAQLSASEGSVTEQLGNEVADLITSSWRNCRNQEPQAGEERYVDGQDDARPATQAPPPRETSNEWRALHALHKGLISKATQSHGNKGVANLEAPEVEKALRALYPSTDDDEGVPQELQDAWLLAPQPADFSAEDIQRTINRKKKGSAADLYGNSFDNLKSIAKITSDSGYAWLAPLINAIIQGRFNLHQRARETLQALRGVALLKKLNVPTAIRPIGIGSLYIVLAASLLHHRLKGDFRTIAGPRQFGVGVRGGTDIAGQIASSAANLGFTIGITDAQNAFNSVRRSKLIKGLNQVPAAQPLTSLRYGGPATVSYNAGQVNQVDITVEEGCIQGDALAAAGFAAAQQCAMAPAVAQKCSGSSRTTWNMYLDDRLLTDSSAVGSVQKIIDSNSAINDSLESANISCGAMNVYKSSFDDDERQLLNDAGAIIEEEGIVFVGVPIGKDSFIISYVEEKVNELIGLIEFAVRVAALDTNQGSQYALNWLRLTIGPTFNHVLRNVPPRLVKAGAQKLDEAVATSVMQLMGLSETFENASAEEKAQALTLLRLPVNMGGCGFASQALLAEAAYLGATASSLHATVGKETGLGIATPEPDADLSEHPVLRDFVAARQALQPFISATLYAKLNPYDLWKKPVHGLQSELSESLHQHARTRFVATLPTGNALDDRGRRINAIGQNTPEASAWISGNPLNPRHKMDNYCITEAYRKRLLLPHKLITNSSATCGGCAANIDPLGTHATCCPNVEKSSQHRSIQEAVKEVIRPHTSILVNVPRVADYYARKPTPSGQQENNTQSQADIGVTLKNTIAGHVTLVDFTVVSSVKSHPTDYPTAGCVAHGAEKAKVDNYDKRYTIPSDRIIGFGVETCGALGPAAKRFLWAAAGSTGGPPHLIARRYRLFIQAISVALQVAMASGMRRFLGRCTTARALTPSPESSTPSTVSPTPTL